MKLILSYVINDILINVQKIFSGMVLEVAIRMPMYNILRWPINCE